MKKVISSVREWTSQFFRAYWNGELEDFLSGGGGGGGGGGTILGDILVCLTI